LTAFNEDKKIRVKKHDPVSQIKLTAGTYHFICIENITDLTYVKSSLYWAQYSSSCRKNTTSETSMPANSTWPSSRG